MGWGGGKNDTSNESRNLALIASTFHIREENKEREREKEERCLKLEEKAQELPWKEGCYWHMRYEQVLSGKIKHQRDLCQKCLEKNYPKSISRWRESEHRYLRQIFILYSP